MELKDVSNKGACFGIALRNQSENECTPFIYGTQIINIAKLKTHVLVGNPQLVICSKSQIMYVTSYE